MNEKEKGNEEYDYNDDKNKDKRVSHLIKD